MSEQILVKGIVTCLRSMGLFAERIFTGTAQNMTTGSWIHGCDKGTCDIIACNKQNEIIFIECKAGSGLRDEQIFFLREQHRHGRHWLVATSIDDVMKHLEDPSYHGPERYTKNIIDETQKFVLKPRVGKKMNMNDLLAFNLWDKKRIDKT